jgi:Zn finger protein HypA/HybF involved in hydrogenase expression
MEEHMSVIDEIAKGASDAVSFASKKTGELTARAKLKLELQAEKGRLYDCYTEIGKLYYGFIKDGDDPSAEIATYVTAVDRSKAKIAELRAKLAELQDNVICPNCHAKVPKNFAYCPTCGKNMEEKPAAEETKYYAE